MRIFNVRYQTDTQISSDGRTHRHTISRNETVLDFAEVINLWCKDESFRTFFIAILADAPFAAYRWETPPLTSSSHYRDFEFVLVDSPSLNCVADPEPFSGYFTSDNSNEGVVVFKNLGGDATLIVPSPRGIHTPYSHLAAFSRTAGAKQNDALWQTVGETMSSCINEKPIWLNTAGGGVQWLHVRLDSRPKYYRHTIYKNFPCGG